MQLLRKLKSSNYYRFRVIVEKILDFSVGIFMFQYQRKDNMFNWFYNCIKYQIIDNPNSSPKYNYYEFGVASGGSIRIYILALKKFCRDYNYDIRKFHIFGFDSFSGLPEPQKEDRRSDWKKGNMTHKKEEVESIIKETKFPSENLHLIEGYFDKTLNMELQKSLSEHRPSIVNIDVDYYSSTMTVLLWLKDILPSGCFFRFDDIWAFYGHPEKGELKAIKDFNSKDFGHLTQFPIFGLSSYSYVYSKKEFEYQ
ncbi:MAG: TylF/MycF/NovP-related O-methyltransferase [bacterium]|nr:TylF/MycF/NovP-related O-methyltransferase [bacterium]